jgi:hypothetical protein
VQLEGVPLPSSRGSQPLFPDVDVPYSSDSGEKEPLMR